jgi:hypothetical protein
MRVLKATRKIVIPKFKYGLTRSPSSSSLEQSVVSLHYCINEIIYETSLMAISNEWLLSAFSTEHAFRLAMEPSDFKLRRGEEVLNAVEVITVDIKDIYPEL